MAAKKKKKAKKEVESDDEEEAVEERCVTYLLYDLFPFLYSLLLL